MDSNGSEMLLYWLGAGSYISWDLGGYNAIIERDTFSAIQWGFGKSPYPWILADLVLEVQDISSQLKASFLHINQGTNDVADRLAGEGVFRLHISFDV